MGKKEIDDRFKKFGTVSFTATSKVNDFMDYLEDGKVMASGCGKCGQTFFPPRADCPGCLSDSLDWVEVDSKGTLETFSEMKFGPVGFEDDLPYTIAVVDFGDFKMFGRLADDMDPDSMNIGMDLIVQPNRLQNGQLNYVFHRP